VAPLANSKKSLITTDKDLGICSDLNRRFHWFDKSFTIPLSEASERFLRANLRYYLFAITDKPLLIWKGNDYFVTQVDLTWDCPLHIKTSSATAQAVLESAFGQKEDEPLFDLKKITELEAQILTGYNEFLFQKVADAFKDKRELDQIQNLEGTRKNLVYLTFFVDSGLSDQEESGKVIFSVPEYALKEPELLPFPQNPIDILQFQESCTRADVFVGKTKISLEDLKQLEPDDIVLLEKSNLHFMTVKGDEEVIFSVNPDPRLVINVDNTTGGKSTMNETVPNTKNIWDNLQVEVGAEFKKIKISLGELRQITEGLVIDIASIVQNEITLHVDNERIALGELVIIEDKYGVKITKVFHETKQEQIAVQEAMNTRQNLPQQPVEQIYEDEFQTEETAVEDEFDYSDFEIEEDL